MNLPVCPNYRERVCERSDIKLGGETADSFLFICNTCKLFWAVSKPKTVERGRWEAKVRSISEATERVKRQAAARVYSFGRRHG